MRYLILVAAILATAACKDKHDEIGIPDAKVKAALALSAFECSNLAPNKAESARLFNVGITAGRQFLNFAEADTNGYKSIASQIDPIWTADGPRPSADFVLGEIHAAALGKVYEYRGRWDEHGWEPKRAALYAEKNCAFLGNTPPPK